MSNRHRPPKSLIEWRKVIKHVVHRLTISPMSYSLLRWRASDTKFRHRYLRRELLRKCPGHFESVRSYSLACHELIWSTVSYHGVQSWRCSNLQCMILREIAGQMNSLIGAIVFKISRVTNIFNLATNTFSKVMYEKIRVCLIRRYI